MEKVHFTNVYFEKNLISGEMAVEKVIAISPPFYVDREDLLDENGKGKEILFVVLIRRRSALFKIFRDFHS